MGPFNSHIYRLLAAILHLGNVNFESEELGYAQIAVISSKALELSANLLGLSKTELKDAILNRTFTTHSDCITMRNDVLMAISTRNSIMKQLYNAMFQFLIDNINKNCDTKFEKSIDILDMAGFGKFFTYHLLFTQNS